MDGMNEDERRRCEAFEALERKAREAAVAAARAVFEAGEFASVEFGLSMVAAFKVAEHGHEEELYPVGGDATVSVCGSCFAGAFGEQWLRSLARALGDAAARPCVEAPSGGEAVH